MFNVFKGHVSDGYNEIVRKGARQSLTDDEFIIREIERFMLSKKRRLMLAGQKYYRGDHDIKRRKREAIGERGNLEEVHNLPNNKIVDNQYRKMVDQKKNYLVGQPLVFSSENKEYTELLKKVFGKRFMRTIKNWLEDFLNCGIAYLYVYYNANGELDFMRLKSHEIIPGWADAEHTELEYVIRFYESIVYKGKAEKRIKKVELYLPEGIYRFVLKSGRLYPDEEPYTAYILTEGAGYNWERIPIIPIKFSQDEIPLIKRLKSLQDAVNLILSNFQNNMEEDSRNTILVLVNYDGADLGKFRKNLNELGAVKVRSDAGGSGDVRTLQLEVNAENYKTILEILKKAIIENAMGYDAKDDRMGGNANQLNIMSMYSDIDLEANDIETELQAAFEDIICFVDAYLYNAGYGDYEKEPVEVIFNRDILISEGEAIENCIKSRGVLSDETVIENHPWIDDPAKEKERLKAQNQSAFEEYPSPFKNREEPVNRVTAKDKGGGADA